MGIRRRFQAIDGFFQRQPYATMVGLNQTIDEFSGRNHGYAKPSHIGDGKMFEIVRDEIDFVAITVCSCIVLQDQRGSSHMPVPCIDSNRQPRQHRRVIVPKDLVTMNGALVAFQSLLRPDYLRICRARLSAANGDLCPV
ncbi:hypothetical protein ASF04_24280 [Duganella sp. Leaf61]|nr:hypothetical protein ASF04_24280 [Duganella sp. Leaf61]